MKVVIEIPEGILDELRTCRFPIQDAYRLCAVIENGTPLPKGHGDLIDRKDLMDRCVTYLESSGATTNLIKSAMTIIEADKEGAE